MNSPRARQPISGDVGFNLLAGRGAGFVIAVDVSLLELLVWGLGSYAYVDFAEIAWFAPRNAALVVLCLLAAGVLGGLSLDHPLAHRAGNASIGHSLGVCTLGVGVVRLRGLWWHSRVAGGASCRDLCRAGFRFGDCRLLHVAHPAAVAEARVRLASSLGHCGNGRQPVDSPGRVHRFVLAKRSSLAAGDEVAWAVRTCKRTTW